MEIEMDAEEETINKMEIKLIKLMRIKRQKEQLMKPLLRRATSLHLQEASLSTWTQLTGARSAQLPEATHTRAFAT